VGKAEAAARADLVRKGIGEHVAVDLAALAALEKGLHRLADDLAKKDALKLL
jgi:hypothetical protein